MAIKENKTELFVLIVQCIVNVFDTSQDMCDKSGQTSNGNIYQGHINM